MEFDTDYPWSSREPLSKKRDRKNRYASVGAACEVNETYGDEQITCILWIIFFFSFPCCLFMNKIEIISKGN